MGLLDGMLGNVLGTALGDNRAPAQDDPLSSILGGSTGASGAPGGHGNVLLQLVLSMLQQNGGLEGVLGKFREAGMGAHADSWVSTGKNMGIAPEQLQQVLGSGTLSDIASQLGVSQEQAGSAMSQVLPEVINQLTPQGQVTTEGDNSIAAALQSLAVSAGR